MVIICSEVVRQRKLKNKEDYKRRKEKDKVKKLSVMFDKQKAALKKDLKLKKDLLHHTLKMEIRVCTQRGYTLVGVMGIM